MTELSKVPVTTLKGVGEAMAEKLAKVGLENLQDLLFHLPLRYQDRTRVVPIGHLRPGQDAVIEGTVSGADVVMGRRRSLVVRLQDGTGGLSLRFYHFSNAQKEGLKRGTRVRCYGEARPGASGLEIYHPEYRSITGDEPPPVDETLTPVYPLTEGLTQQRLRQLCQQTLTLLGPSSLPDWLPTELARDYQLAPLADAIRYLHHPPADADVDELALGHHWAQHRLAFEELLTHQLSQQRLRESLRSLRAPAMPKARDLPARYLANLGFTPTGAQQRVGNEIAYDLSQPGAHAAADPGRCRRRQDRGRRPCGLASLGGRLSGGVDGAHRNPRRTTFHHLPALARTAGHRSRLAGRQAQGQEPRRRPGADRRRRTDGGRHPCAVPGRSAIQEPGPGDHRRTAPLRRATAPGPAAERRRRADVPSSTDHDRHADPADSGNERLRRPRHLDPRRTAPGRTPVNTVLVTDTRRVEVIERVRSACAEGRQAYWVCTLIEESEELTCQAAETTFEDLTAALGELKVGLIHGRMKPAEKAAVMAEFKAGALQLLVATTVIEVGVDVPNASLMIIENPERLGLAQLHQLRGRVGRGSAASHCVLLYHPPLSQIGRQRLGIMRETNDGFVIAEKRPRIARPR